MKKVIAVAFTVLIILTMTMLTGCGAEDIGDEADNSTVSETKQDYLEIYKKIVQNIECSDYEIAVELCGELESISTKGKEMVMDALVTVINSQTKTVLTSFCTDDDLMDDDIIDRFKQFKKITDALWVDETDYTNVVKYIDLVVSIEQYKKYEPLWILMQSVEDDFNNGNTYFEMIETSYSDFLKEYYADLSRTYYEKCYETSLNYDANQFGISTATRVFDNYVYELSNFINYGYYNPNYELSYEWEYEMNQALEAWNEIADTLKKLPTSVYYGE